MALSRKERGPGVAGRCCARERVALCARVRIGQGTGSMRCTCLLLYESIPDVVLERFSVNHGRRSWRVSQLADQLAIAAFDATCVHENVCAIIAHSGVCVIALAWALFVEQSMDCPREAWIHALRSSIHGLSESMLCAQHTY